MIKSETSRSVLLKKFVLRSVIVTLLKSAYKWNSFFSIFDIFFRLTILRQTSCITSTMSGAMSTTSTTSGTTRFCEWYYETLRGDTSDTMKHWEVLRVVLWVTTRYYEWYFKTLRGTTGGTTSHYVVLKDTLRGFPLQEESCHVMLQFRASFLTLCAIHIRF